MSEQATEHVSLVERIERSAATIAALASLADPIEAAAAAITASLTGGGTVYTCGNGGSAAEAIHLAEELIGNYKDRSRPPQRGVSLCTDAAALTCIANDFGFDQVFARQCEALLTERDVLVALSTSGNSPNVVNALAVARAKGATTIGLLGRGGGEATAHCDHAIVVPGEESAHAQEAHLVIVHLFCEAVEAHASGPRITEGG